MEQEPPPPRRLPSDTASEELLQRAQRGERHALDVLIARYLPQLRQWVHRVLPHWARSVADTADVVHETLLHTLVNLRAFEPRKDGALRAYLRRALLNRVRDQIRHANVRKGTSVIDEDVFLAPHQPAGTSPLEAAIAQQEHEHYISALRELSPTDRHAIVARIELGYSYEQLAIALGKSTPGAARVAVRRGLVRLAKTMASGSR
jgi:RNA polymerase sigma-70 factor (ECF subfamily)